MANRKWSVKAIRVDMDKTQEDFAKLIDKTLVSYCNKENGKSHFTYEEIKIISEYSDVPIDNIRV